MRELVRVWVVTLTCARGQVHTVLGALGIDAEFLEKRMIEVGSGGGVQSATAPAKGPVLWARGMLS